MYLITTTQILTGIGIGIFVIGSFVFAWWIDNGGRDDKKDKDEKDKKDDSKK